jgi:hypothetical protein
MATVRYKGGKESAAFYPTNIPKFSFRCRQVQFLARPLFAGIAQFRAWRTPANVQFLARLTVSFQRGYCSRAVLVVSEWKGYNGRQKIIAFTGDPNTQHD